ncbi:MAG: dihydropteroate synthase [Opitutaceae bacterium]|nr:dihydropteroate synthase [Opitutaceae bacterium]
MLHPVSSATHPPALQCRGHTLLLAGRMHVVGILNVSPESFFDGAKSSGAESALERAKSLVAEGASLIDVGGQSTRPGYVELSPEEETARVVPVIEALTKEVAVPISIDTYKAPVAEAALKAGAHVLNDIFGLQRDPSLAELAARHGAAVIAMHQEKEFSAFDGDPVARVRNFFRKTLRVANAAGIPTDRLVLDPGIGFGKTQAQNLDLIARLGELRDLRCALLLAASRKSVIGNILNLPPQERLEGTLATTAAAVWQGVDFVRVHDVAANLRIARMAEALRARTPLS